MKLNILSAAGEPAENKLEVSDAVFDKEFKESLIHQVVTSHLSGARSGTKGQKSRSTASGGGIKPWRQKGTGRARAGSSRSPIWRSGGKTFAATNRDFSKKVNKKMYRSAMCSIISELIRQERLIVIEELTMAAPKTKELVARLKSLSLNNVLILTEEYEANLHLSSRNIVDVEYQKADSINPVNLLSKEKVLTTVAALKKIEEILT
jgi:large subunit ribosomal protein L4